MKYEIDINQEAIMSETKHKICPYYKECGGCQYQNIPYQEEKKIKQNSVEKLLGKFGDVNEIIGMDNPENYRNKITSTFDYSKRSGVIAGFYRANTHEVIDIKRCMIQDKKADEIIATIKKFTKSFKMETYDEDTGRGFLRHVLIKTGFATGQVMVVLVVSSHMFPGKNNYIKAIRKIHPEISTIIMNINDRNTSVVLGDREIVIYGKGYIEDTLCGMKFQISAKSFYQVNPVQAEKLYNKAIKMANLIGDEVVIDAYSGIGTISIILSKKVKEVIGVEINHDAVRDSIRNAKSNNVKNVYFYKDDASDFMIRLAEENKKVDLVVMDPPRDGSDVKFLSSLVKLAPEKVIYISCNPETQTRDLGHLVKNGYKVKEIQPVDMFPRTEHVECCALMSRERKGKHK